MEREDFMKKITVTRLVEDEKGLRFEETKGITEEEFLGEKEIEGSIFLGDHPYLPGLTEIPKGFNPRVNGNLKMNEVIYLPSGFSPKVKGYISLGKVKSFPEGFNPEAEVLYLNVSPLPKEFNFPDVKEINIQNEVEIPEGFSPTINGDLCFQLQTKIPNSFSPKVRGNLILASVKKIGENFSPEIGGDLGFQRLRKSEEEIKSIFKGKLKGSVFRGFFNKFNRKKFTL